MNYHISKRLFLGAAAALAILAGQGAWAQETVKVGAINPLSGPVANYGDEVTRGYELCADAVNAQGGVLGKNLEIVRGNATSPQEGITAVEQLAGRENVDAFIGTYLSAVAAAASEAALNYQKIYWDTNAIAANLTERGLPNFIRSGPYANSFSERAAQGVIELIAPALGKQPQDLKVYIEHEDSIYGTSLAERQKELLEEAGVQVVGVGAHSARAIDLTDSILRAKDAAPDVWMQTGYVPDGNLLLKTARDQGFNPPAMLLVGTGDTPETLEAFGPEALEGILVVGYPRPDIAPSYGPGAAEYLEAYRAKYNRDPIAPQSMAAYVGCKIMAEAINAAGSTEMDAVREAAAAIDKPEGSYETGFGVMFDEKMQNTRAFPTIVQWQGGNVVTVYPKEAAAQGAELVDLARR